MAGGDVLRIVFFGTPGFAVPTLAALLASRHEVVGVVTQPDRPRGRGQQVAEPPAKLVGRQAGVPVWQPERLKDEAWLARLRAARPDIGVVAAYGRILPQVLLDVPPLGLLNVHASLLPAYRGASPVHRAVMNGDHETGVTIMKVVLALDAGPMLGQQRRPIGPDETSEEVEHDLARLGAALIMNTLEAVEAGTAVETPQDDALATFAPRLRKEEGAIDWNLPARALHNHVRGLHPWPHAFTFVDHARLVVLRGRVDQEPTAAEGQAAEPGTVLEAHGDRFVVAAGAGSAYQLRELQPEGRRVMTAREFLAGRHIPAGARLTSS
jgi:methionyl-tRNA formyltransferase